MIEVASVFQLFTDYIICMQRVMYVDLQKGGKYHKMKNSSTIKNIIHPYRTMLASGTNVKENHKYITKNEV